MLKSETLSPEFREKVYKIRCEFEQETGYALGIISARRTIKEQDALYAESKDGDGISDNITNARGGYSPHNFGYAVDLCPLLAPDRPWWQAPEHLWLKLEELSKKHGLVWGGNFKKICDKPHIEDPKWKEAQAAWKRGEIEVA